MSGDKAWRRGPKSLEETEKVALAMVHPVRSVLLNLLGARPGSGAAELAKWSGEPIRRVRGQLKVLADDGLIRVERQETRRGVAARYYSNALELVLTEEHDAELPEPLRRLVAITTVRLVIDSVKRAMSAGTLLTRPEWTFGNTQAMVDDQGWKELAELHNALLERTQEVVAESRARLEASGEEPNVFFTSGVMLFENPPLDKGDA